MIYQGFSQVEVDRISNILKLHNAEFSVSIPESLIEKAGAKLPRDSAVFQIELSDEELNKIPEKDRMKLNDLRIHGEMESPFTDEELATYTDPTYKTPVKPSAPQSKMNQWATILAVGVMLAFFIYKKLNS
jgi:hypothetical protein